MKRGVVSSVPCGVVDVAPTVLHLLGLKPAVDMDGRVLAELLAKGPMPEEMRVSEETREVEWNTGQDLRRQVVRYGVVDDHRYVDLVRIY
jgi:arylsulfatase A-like enzyme